LVEWFSFPAYFRRVSKTKKDYARTKFYYVKIREKAKQKLRNTKSPSQLQSAAAPGRLNPSVKNRGSSRARASSV
jgi:hypothetical protein